MALERALFSGFFDSREDESIAVQPLGVLGVEVHELVEENVGNRSHTPRGALSANLLKDDCESLGTMSVLDYGTYMGAPGWPELLLKVASTWKKKQS